MLVTEPLSIAGTVLEPARPGYDDARTVWNGAVDRRPALIAQCLTADDVAVAVRHARANELPDLGPRAAATAAAGHAVVDDGLMIDLSRMKRVDVDRGCPRRAASSRASCSASSTGATQEHGAGRARRHRLAHRRRRADARRRHRLAAAQARPDDRQPARGRARHRRRRDRPCERRTRTPTCSGRCAARARTSASSPSSSSACTQVGPMVTGGLHASSRSSRRHEILRGARDVLAAAPDELTTALVLLTVPPHAAVPCGLWGRPAVGIAPTYAGDLDEAQRVIAPLRALGEPALDLVGPMPYVALQSMLDETAPHGLHNYNAAETLAELDGRRDRRAARASSPRCPRRGRT